VDRTASVSFFHSANFRLSGKNIRWSLLVYYSNIHTAISGMRTKFNCSRADYFKVNPDEE
jgi:hypothetical protein